MVKINVESGDHTKNGANPKSLTSRKLLLNLNLDFMKKSKMIFAACIATALFSSCALTLPVTATSNPVGSKVGKAVATGYLGSLFFDADASIQTAAKNGGITKISTVDMKNTSVLGIIVTHETIVTGE